MDTSIGLLFLLQIILIALNAIFASAEIAVLSINETKLERMAEEGNPRAKRLFRLTREPAKFLATIQVAITLSGFLGSAFAADNFSEPLVAWLQRIGVPLPKATLDALAVIVITLILSYVTLIFGELVPKRIAMKKSEKIAMGISGLVSGISFFFHPIVWFLSLSTNVVLRMFGIDPNQVEEEVGEEEIRMMVDAGTEQGTIDHQEKEWIQNVFDFGELTAGDVATHRVDVTVLWSEDTDEQWAQTVYQTRHTFYPICEESTDNVVGVLNAKEYLRLEERDRATVLAQAVETAYFVPETIRAEALLRNMKENKNPFAVVLDEYGGMEGVVTRNDIVEKLVGDFHDAEDGETNPEPYAEVIEENVYRVHGNMTLEALEELTGLSLVTEDYDTLTGLVFDALGVIPSDGTASIRVELSALTVEILTVEEHQIQEAILTVLPTEVPEDAEERKPI